MALQQNQTGFSPIEIVFILFVGIIVGLVGTYVYSAKTAADKQLAAAHSKLTSNQTNRRAAKTAALAKLPLADIFEIPEWGLQTNYPGKLHLEYMIDDSNPDIINLSSAELNAGGPGSCTTAKAAAGYIRRYNPAETVTVNGRAVGSAWDYVETYSADTSPNHIAYSKINGQYYIYFIGPANSCHDQAARHQAITDFENVANHLKSK